MGVHCGALVEKPWLNERQGGGVARRSAGIAVHAGQRVAGNPAMPAAGAPEGEHQVVSLEMERSEREQREKWARVIARLKAEIGQDLYKSWFVSMEFEGREDHRLRVSVATRFLRNYIQEHYADRLLRLSDTELCGIDSLFIRVRQVAVAPRPTTNGAAEAAHQAAEPPMAAASAGGTKLPLGTDAEPGSPLDHNLTFENFALGPSNALAHAAALRVVEAAAGAPANFNPLFLHSAAGLGKTHLLNAISWRIRERHPERRVVFLSVERFMYHFIAALKAKDVLAFKEYLQTIDVLLIDDFQFLKGATMLQEFCHTLNSLVDARRQVILAADVPPAQLDSVDQRMRSRLAGGLVADIMPPDLDLRRRILETRLRDAAARDPSIAVPADVIEFIANRIESGGRELEGALNRVIASQQLTGARMTLELAAVALRDFVPQCDAPRIRIDDILRVVGQHYNVPKTDLLSTRRARSVVRPRQVGMYLAKKLTLRSLPEIGRRFGGRDHSTVLHAVRRMEDLLERDEKFAREMGLLVRLLEHP
jgi:chromosomal replication initiator protein